MWSVEPSGALAGLFVGLVCGLSIATGFETKYRSMTGSFGQFESRVLRLMWAVGAFLIKLAVIGAVIVVGCLFIFRYAGSGRLPDDQRWVFGVTVLAGALIGSYARYWYWKRR